MDSNTTLVLMTDEELNAAVQSLDRVVAAVSDLRSLLAGHEAATALPQAVMPEANRRRKAVKLVDAKKPQSRPRKAKAPASAPRSGAPCTVCGGEVDRTGCGGYKRTVCAACKAKGAPANGAACKAKGAPANGAAAGSGESRVDRIRRAFERVDAISTDQARREGA
jgi:hypothetical protein